MTATLVVMTVAMGNRDSERCGFGQLPLGRRRCERVTMDTLKSRKDQRTHLD